MSTIANNKNKYAKYLIDSKFNVHSYDDIIKDGSSELFSIVLSASAWDEEEKTQVVENEIFSSTGYVYTINIFSDEEKIQWVGADISVAVEDGAAIFSYATSKPTSNINVWLVRENLEGESNVVCATNEIILDDQGNIESSSMSIDDMIAALEG